MFCTCNIKHYVTGVRSVESGIFPCRTSNPFFFLIRIVLLVHKPAVGGVNLLKALTLFPPLYFDLVFPLGGVKITPLHSLLYF